MLEPGATIGRYTVIRLLGEGGMGAVYLAHDGQLDRRVALKLLHTTTSADARARMAREARVMARFVHPNIVTVYDAGDSNGQFFIVMEFIEGQTLGEWLAAEPRSVETILTTFRTAGVALAEAHAAGVAHRDFKPDNVLLDKSGRIAVSDFGIASEGAAAESVAPLPSGLPSESKLPALPLAAMVSSNASSLTRTGTMMGTPAYMSPEQFLGRPAGPASDQFSFSVALYEALFKEPPFPAQTLEELRRAVLRGEIAPLPDAVRAKVPASVIRALVRGMAREPEGRFSDMRAMLAALEPKKPRSRALGVVVAVVVAVVIIAGGGFFAWRKLQAEQAKKNANARTQRLAREGGRQTCKSLGTELLTHDCFEMPGNGPPPHIYFAVDKSRSMAAHRNDEKAVFLKLSAHFGLQAAYGLSLFPPKGAAECTPGGELRGAATSLYTPQREPDHHADIVKDLDTPANGLTPTAATLRELGAAIKKRKTPSKAAIVLVTDGGANCGATSTCAAKQCTLNIESQTVNGQVCSPNGPSCCNGEANAACLDDVDTIAALKALATDGIHTWVAGVSPADRYKDVLDRFAAAGGTKHSFDAGTGLDDLAADMQHTLIMHVPTCMMGLPIPVEHVDTAAVLFDGQLAPPSWKLDRSHLILSGAACDRIMNREVGHIRIVSE